MTFLNVILLAGAAALLIPLILHLLNKRRMKTVQWGAMHLLQEALRQRKRNLKTEQLLLLLTRIALPVILALCLARPALSFLRQLPGANKTSLLVLLDNSYSMRSPAGASTVRDQARDGLQALLQDLPAGSDVNILLCGEPAQPLFPEPVTLRESITPKLAAESSLAGPLKPNAIFQQAQAELKRMGNTAKEIVLISDFQESDWKAVAEGATLDAWETLKKSEPAPQLTFYRVGGEVHDNLNLVSVEPSALIVAGGQEVALRARIQNHGAKAYQDIPVHLEADGIRLRSTRVSVAPNAESILTMTHAFDSPGDHAVTLRLEGDSFPDDNAFTLVLPVRAQVNCLLLTNGETTAPLEGASDFLEIALAPNTAAKATSLRDIIHTEVLDARRVRDKSYDGQQVIVMADIQKLDGKGLPMLEEFVRKGGGLIVFMGPNCDEKWYREQFFKDGKGLLPGIPKGFGHVDEGQTPSRVLSQRHTHPATTYFNSARGLRLQDAGFTHWQKFEKVPEDARAVLSLDRGDPLAIEKAFGQGRVILFTSTANARWNNLPLQPVYVPLMQRIITYLTMQNTPPPSQLCGTVLRVPVSPEQSGASFTLTNPGNQTFPLKPQATGDKSYLISYAGTQVPGTYELRNDAEAKTAIPKRYAFNLDPEEANLAVLTGDKVKEMANRAGAAYAESASAYHQLDRSRRHGTEVWQPLLMLMLVGLFAEVFLQQRISRG